MPIVLASASRKEKIFVETRCAEGRSNVHAVYFDERIIFSPKLIHILSCISSSLLSVSLSLSLLRLSTSTSFQLKYYKTTTNLSLSAIIFVRMSIPQPRCFSIDLSRVYIYIYDFFPLSIFSRNERKNRLTLKKYRFSLKTSYSPNTEYYYKSLSSSDLFAGSKENRHLILYNIHIYIYVLFSPIPASLSC